jgi:hypothetical protein
MDSETLGQNLPDMNKDDDFFVLSHLFALPQLNYVDITRKERVPQITSRWILLGELVGYDKSNMGQE